MNDFDRHSLLPANAKHTKIYDVHPTPNLPEGLEDLENQNFIEYGTLEPKDWDNETKKAWLKRYTNCKNEFNAYTDEIKRLEASTRKLTRVLTGMPSGNITARPEDKWADILDYQNEIIEYLTVLSKDQLEILKEVKLAIDLLEDENQKWVLIERYIEGKNFNQIIVASGYSERAVFKIHSKALENLIPIV